MFSNDTANQANASTAQRTPRLAIRVSYPLKTKPDYLRQLKIGFVVALAVALTTGSFGISQYIRALKTKINTLQAGLESQLSLSSNQQKKLVFFETAIKKATLTSYVPYLGGINGGMTLANGEPVIPIAASRKALANGSVKMGDWVLLVGQIKDKKGPTILDNSFDVMSPDMQTASYFGKRPFHFVNLSRPDSPYNQAMK